MSPVPVWIDTDPAVGVAKADVGDGFALLQALRSPELEVVGVSTVFGNTDLGRAHAIAGELLGVAGALEVPLHRGADSAERLGEATPASDALTAALERRRLVVLALGPLTNVATVLVRRPELVRQIDRVIAVAGRRPGQCFTVGTGANPLADFNFECDVPAATELLTHLGLDLELAGFEVASHVWLGAAEIERLRTGPAGARWLADPAERWLEHWHASFGVEGFHPFDTLAVTAAARPELIAAERIDVKIVGRPAVALESDRGSETPETAVELHAAPGLSGGRPARYAHRPDPGFRDDLMARLLRD